MESRSRSNRMVINFIYFLLKTKQNKTNLNNNFIYFKYLFYLIFYFFKNKIK